MYHYTECGLDNVWLANGYKVSRTAYGKGVSVDRADQLSDAIALSLIAKKGRLSGKEFRFLRTKLELSQQSAGRFIGATEQSVSLWERTGKVPQYADTIIRSVYAEQYTGNPTILAVIDRVNTVERLCSQRIVMSEGKTGWKPKSDLEELQPQ